MLNSNVLVLNRLYQPVDATTARRAFTLLAAGAARAAWMASSNCLITRPGRRWARSTVMMWCARRPGCSRCRASLCCRRLTASHGVESVFRGTTSTRATTTRANTATAILTARPSTWTTWFRGPRVAGPRGKTWCAAASRATCARAAAHMDQAGMKVVKTPTRPRWSPLFRLPRNVRFDEWKPFLDPVDASYWNTELQED